VGKVSSWRRLDRYCCCRCRCVYPCSPFLSASNAFCGSRASTSQPRLIRIILNAWLLVWLPYPNHTEELVHILTLLLPPFAFCCMWLLCCWLACCCADCPMVYHDCAALHVPGMHRIAVLSWI
jgi:hypothetical protein